MREENRRVGGKGWRLAVLLLSLHLFAAPEAFGAEPFQVGEKLDFSIRYGFIRAGTATLEVNEDRRNGSWTLTSSARTNSFFDVFFMVRDQVKSWIDPVTFESLRFEKRLREGGYSKDELVLYDRENRVARYGDSTEVGLLPGTRDILAAFFHLRTQRLTPGAKIPLTYHASKKNWPIHVHVHKVETIKVPAGKFRCFRIEPYLRSVGVFKQTGRLQIWVTADDRRMPVKLESKVVFGAFEAVLTSFETSQ